MWLIPALVLGLALVVLGVIVAITQMLRASDACDEAWFQVEHDPAVQAAIGEPLREGNFVTGNLHTNLHGTGGRAQLAIPFSGPRGHATAYSIEVQLNGAWEILRLQVVIDGTGQKITVINRLPLNR